MTDAVLELPGGARALFTSREHGNLSSVSGDGHEHGASARARLRERLGVRRIVRGYQEHGIVVGRVYRDDMQAVGNDDGGVRAGVERHTVRNGLAGAEGPSAGGLEQPASQPAFRADGHAVAAPGIAAMVLVADCVPVVLAADGAAAALHAGWRGLAAGVLEEGVRALRDVGGEGPVSAVIGPCAGECCYEVGEDVHSAFGTGLSSGEHIDLRAIARQRLVAAGADDVQDVQACTICDERYFSHRREGARAGRQAALAWLA